MRLITLFLSLILIHTTVLPVYAFKLQDKAAYASPDNGAVLYVEDLKDTTDGPTGTTKKLQIKELFQTNYGEDMLIGNVGQYGVSILANNGSKLYVDNGGNIGIGDTTPSYKLEVNGTLMAQTLNSNGAYSLTVSPGLNGQSLIYDGNGLTAWATISGGSTPGGTDTQVQFNNGGSALGGDSGFTYNKTTELLAVNGLSLSNGSITTSGSSISFGSEHLITTGHINGSTITASSTITGSNLSGTNTGDQTISLTGDVTGSGTGSFATTVAANSITTSKILNGTVALADLAGNSVSTSKILNGTILAADLGTIAISTFTNDAGYSTTTGTVTSVALAGDNGFALKSGSPITSSGTLTGTLNLAAINTSSLNNDAGWTTNTGTVTSVAATGDNGIALTGSPITSAGTLALTLNLASIGTGSLSNTGNFITASSSDTLTNKSISGSANTITAITSSAITNGTILNIDINSAANIDASKLGTGIISNTELNYINGVTSNIQTQLDAKGVGTVTSVALAGDNGFALKSGSPITGSGTLTGTLDLASIGTGSLSNTAGFITASSSDTLTNKAINGGSNTITGIGSSAIIDGSVTGADINNGTITAVDLSTIANSTFTNDSGYITSSSSDTLINKSISGSSNTLTNITTGAITNGTILNVDISSSANIDATKLATGIVSNTELNYINGVTSNIQTQLDSKGTVSSVAVSGDNGITINSGSPITGSGTIALTVGALTPLSVAATGTVTGSNLSGTNTGDQTITLTGDVTGSGTGSFAATIASGSVTSTKILDATIATADLANNLITTGKILNGTILAADLGTIAISTFTNDSGYTSNLGTVTSVAVSGDNGITISGSPVTTSGTITATLGNITPLSVTSVGDINGAALYVHGEYSLPHTAGLNGYVLASDGNGETIWTLPSSSTDYNYLAQDFTDQTSVTVTHNFGAYPIVQVILSNGDVELVPTIEHTSVDEFVVTMSSESNGTILATLGSPRYTPECPINTIYSNTTLNSTHCVILADANGGDLTVTLPSVSGIAGREYNIKMVDSNSTTVTLDAAGSELIDNSLTQVINVKYNSVRVKTDGVSWFVL